MEPALSHLIDRVRAAAADQQPLRICGGGSKDFLGCSLQGEPLDMRSWQGVVDYEPSELVITVRAGTPLAQVETLLAQRGQTLAFEPPHFAQQGHVATVGGMVAAGLSGPSRSSVGAVRDYVLGVELINGKGELLRYGGQVMKNVAGYDVSRLMAGSWGTLGAITEVSLKVLPVAPAHTTLRFTEVSQKQALHMLNTWGGQPLPLNASCWQVEQGVGVLYVRLKGAFAAVEAACKTMGGAVLEQGEAGWHACREHDMPWFAEGEPEDCLWRLSVPQTAPVLDLPDGIADPLVEWHGGLRWVHAPRSAGTQLKALAQAAGGDALLFRAEQGQPISGEPLFAPQNPAVQRIQAQLQRAFDPAGIFNPGRTQKMH